MPPFLTPTFLFKSAYVIGLIVQLLIRAPYQRARRETKITDRRVDNTEQIALVILLLGNFVLPMLYTPSARENASIVVDPTTGSILLFGGKSDSNTDDLWTFDPTAKTWTQIDATGPTARKSHDAVLDPLTQQMYLFGGSTDHGAANDLWMLAKN